MFEALNSIQIFFKAHFECIILKRFKIATKPRYFKPMCEHVLGLPQVRFLM